MREKDNKVQLEVVGVSHTPNMGNAFALILQELEGNRRLPIVIGEPETQSIIMILEKIPPQRPMTHDLFVVLCVEHNIEISEILIYKMENGTFYSKLICKDYKGNIKEIDSRTSDAISLALRFECSIYIYESIIEKCGIDLNSTNTVKHVKSGDLTKYNINQLEKTLNDAVKKEDFEKAATIRDLISKKRKN